MKFLHKLIVTILDLVFYPIVLLIAILSRLTSKSLVIGIGPEPLINNVHHKKALELYGYKVETFVTHTYYITDNFDKRFDKFKATIVGKLLVNYFVFIYSLLRYKVIYIYFNGGTLGLFHSNLKYFEAFFYHLAGVKIVVMPYGGDCYISSQNPNLIYKNSYFRDYPKFIRQNNKKLTRQVDYWIKNADHVISGCDWVYYTWHWDTLMTAHFSIDMNYWFTSEPYSIPSEYSDDRPLKILHAPNHTNIKGSAHLIKAIEELKQYGYHIELIFLQAIPNNELRDFVANVDVVCDQLVIGWHGIFALEVMAMGKPVICNLSQELIELYVEAGLILENEIPIISADTRNIKEIIIEIYNKEFDLLSLSKKSIEYVKNHHSLEYVGKIFDKINKQLLGASS